MTDDRKKKKPDPALARFAASLARLRERAGWTQYALAKAALVSPIGLARMERGETDVRLTTLSRLAEALGVTPDELCGWPDDDEGA